MKSVRRGVMRATAISMFLSVPRATASSIVMSTRGPGVLNGGRPPRVPAHHRLRLGLGNQRPDVLDTRVLCAGGRYGGEDKAGAASSVRAILLTKASRDWCS